MSELDLKLIPLHIIGDIEKGTKAMLHASRDAMRNRGEDTVKSGFNINCPYYAEAFGIMRGMVLLGYGYFGPSNMDAFEHAESGFGPEGRPYDPENNVKWWLSQLEREVLEEENWRGSGRCKYCLENFGKDDKSVEESKTSVNW